jgi:DNA polymerase III subunit epsilon
MTPLRTPLRRLPVLVLDCQATGASPEHGHLLEIGWLVTRADLAVDESAVSCSLVALPDDATIPAIVRELTGVAPDDVVGAPSAAEIWARVRAEIDRIAEGGVAPAVIHFARFERAFLRALHERELPGTAFPLAPVCTHEIARRLLPGTPRLGLRALAGYFGHATDELRRSHGHVWATALVWRHLVDALAQVGVETLPDLERWLEVPAPRPKKRVYPMPREVRLALPDTPGVYRMLRTGGDVLYVGKATSLRKRVNQYFQKQSNIPDRMLEMLSQARELDVTPTASALEAALLETDEIKRLVPPFNQALVHANRTPWFAAAELADLAPVSSPVHVLGPLGSSWHVRRWLALVAALSRPLVPEAECRTVLAALGRPSVLEVDPAVLQAGFASFARTLPPGPLDLPVMMRWGAVLWREQLALGQVPPSADEEPALVEDAPWDAEDVHERLAEVVLVLAHAVRRARWMCALVESSVAFVDGGRARRLVLERGAIVEHDVHEPGTELPVPPGWKRGADERRAAFDVATFDRLRVLTTELRRVSDAGAAIAARFGPHRRLSGDRLRRVLAWV